MTIAGGTGGGAGGDREEVRYGSEGERRRASNSANKRHIETWAPGNTPAKKRRTVPHVTLLAPNMVAGDYSCVRINAHTLTHTQTYTRSLSLSPTHTHMHLCLSFSKYTHIHT